MKISMLHPSRGRVVKSYCNSIHWLGKTSGADVELIVSIDDDDPERGEYLREYSQINPMICHVISNPNRSAVDAINRAARVCTGEIMIVVSDDTDCPNEWPRLILDAVQGREDYVLRVDDGIQKWLITAPIIDRKYYDRFGYVYHPDYRHIFVDTEFTHVADILGRTIRADHINFQHRHPCKGLGQMDDIYRRSDATFQQGKEVYLRRFRESFGILGVDPWNLHPSAAGHIQWLKQNL